MAASSSNKEILSLSKLIIKPDFSILSILLFTSLFWFESSKSSLLNRMPYVPYVPAWCTCPRAHLPTCQKRANFSFLSDNVPTFQKECHFFNFACQKVGQFSSYFSKELCFFIYLINLYPIYFIYFVYFKYIPNIYFLYEYFFFYQTLYIVCKKSMQKNIHHAHH